MDVASIMLYACLLNRHHMRAQTTASVTAWSGARGNLVALPLAAQNAGRRRHGNGLRNHFGARGTARRTQISCMANYEIEGKAGHDAINCAYNTGPRSALHSKTAMSIATRHSCASPLTTHERKDF